MKIVLIIPLAGQMSEKTEDPGGLSISACLKKHGEDVLVYQKREENIPWQEIVQFQPDMVAFCVYYPSRELVYKLTKKFKELLSDIMVCVGGIEATISSKAMVEECAAIDFLVKGEGEITVIELIEEIKGGHCYAHIKGLLYRQGQTIIENEDREMPPDLDLLPWIDRIVIKENRIHNAYISTSRGCTASCTFCLTPSTYKGRWRGRSVTDVVDELEYLNKEYNISCYHFSDASLEDPDDNCERLNSLLDEIIRRDMKICYSAELRTDFHEKATDELMKKLKKSGLTSVFIGVESHNAADHKLLNKRGTLEDNDSIIALFHAYDIEVQLGFINFTPYSTLQGIRSNIEFLKRHQYLPDLKLVQNRAIPYFKTALNKIIKRDNLFINEKNMEYKFVDEKVGMFHSMITRYFEELNSEEFDAINNISLYFSTWNNYFLQIKNCYIAQYSEGNEFMKAVKQYEDTYKALKWEINESNYRFLDKILIMLDSDSIDYEAFVDIKNQMLSLDKLQIYKNRINACILKFFKCIYRLDMEYAGNFLELIKLEDNVGIRQV